MSLSPREIKAAIEAEALRLGFDAFGVCAAQTRPEDKANLKAFVDQGLHGEMAWMADTLERRADPQTLWPEARSVIVLGASYAPSASPLGEDKNRGAITVYARNKDYHDVLKKRQKRLARWMVERWGCEVKVFVDTAPVMEGPLAQAAGLGWIGKHTNLVSRDFGSYLFLCEIFTTLELPHDAPGTDLCGSCTACLEACPTQAFLGPGQIDARACVSYLTIEKKTPISPQLAAKLGNRIYGCDDCVAVCPWNKFAPPSQDPAFHPRPALVEPDLVSLAALDDAGFRALFQGSPIKRIKRARFLRNVAHALGSLRSKAGAGWKDALETLAQDPEPLISEAASQGLMENKEDHGQ